MPVEPYSGYCRYCKKNIPTHKQWKKHVKTRGHSANREKAKKLVEKTNCAVCKVKKKPKRKWMN